MSLTLLTFYGFAALQLLGLGIMLSTRRVVHAGFALFLVLLANAGLFVLAGSDFLGIAQLVVYVGGILVLLLFGVMLTHRQSTAAPRTALIRLGPGLLVSGGLLLLLLYVFGLSPGTTALAAREPGGTEALGLALLSRWLVPFEAASLFLLLALIAASFLARKRNQRLPAPPPPPR